MKKQNKVILLLSTIVVIYNSQLLGQENLHKPFTLGSLSLNKGIIYSDLDRKYGSHNDFLKYSPAHAELALLDTGYIWTNSSISGIDLGAYGSGSSVLIGFHPYSKEKQAYNYNRELRLGVSFNTRELNAYGSNSTIIGDTTIRSTAHYRGTSNYIGIDGSFLFKTDPERRFSFYFGYGINLGISYNSSLMRYSGIDTMVTITIGGSQHTYWLNSNYYSGQYESYPLHNSYYVNMYLPYGYNFRLAKTKPILSNFSLFGEGRIGMNISSYKGGNNLISKSFNLTTGIRYNLVKAS